MERDDVIKIFNDLISGERREIEFSKGYIVLTRREFGYLVVITYDR